MTILLQEQTTVQPKLDIAIESEIERIAPNLIDTTWVREVLLVAAERARSHYLYENGENYSTEDLLNCFIFWLDSCLEELTDYAFEMCVTGEGFNRHAFEMALLKIKPVEEIEKVSTQNVA